MWLLDLQSELLTQTSLQPSTGDGTGDGVNTVHWLLSQLDPFTQAVSLQVPPLQVWSFGQSELLLQLLPHAVTRQASELQLEPFRQAFSLQTPLLQVWSFGQSVEVEQVLPQVVTRQLLLSQVAPLTQAVN